MSVAVLVPDSAPAVEPRSNPPRLVALPPPPAPTHRLEVEGGVPLRGTVALAGAKNEVLPALCATLLTGDPVVLRNVPRILDVEILAQILGLLGSEVTWLDRHSVRIHARSDPSGAVPDALGRRLRASILLAGPLLARTGRATLPLPGGDAIGRRRLDTHFQGLLALGATLEVDSTLELRARGLQGADLFLDEPSVTGTENILMAAVLARGTTILRNAACEPHVQGLCRMLVAMGARITGIGTGTLVVEGVAELRGCEHEIGPDALEVGTFAAAAVMTGGDVTMTGARVDELRMVKHVFARLGVELEMSPGRVRVRAEQAPVVRPDVFGAVPRIDDGPWPAFPTDLLGVTLAMATQCSGTVLFFEKMYEGRLFFTDQLAAAGASVILCDPHRVVVHGRTPLHPVHYRCPDVRAGMAMVLSALSAEGRSTLVDVHHVDRGYQDLEARLSSLGARIRRT